MGANRLHIVDLDGAARGEPVNREMVKQIASIVQLPTQLGGGIRTMDTVKEMLKLGIDRVILGTAAVEEPRLVETICRSYSESVIVSIDTRDGLVATHGWQKETTLSAFEFARSMAGLGVKRFIFTDISRGSTLTEPNFSAFAELAAAIRLPVIMSGGVSSLTHVVMLKKLGAEAVIIGKALYTGKIDLKQALAAISNG